MTCHQKVVFVILMIAGTSAFNVSAQYVSETYKNHARDSTTTTNKKLNVIKGNVLAYVVGNPNITFERLARTAPRSLNVKLEYYYYSDTEYELRGPTITAGIRYYLTKKRQPPAGYYIQPVFLYGEYNYTDKTRNTGAQITQAGGGVIGGKQWAIANIITIEVFLGAAYVNVTATNFTAKAEIEAFQIILGGSFGFRF